LIGTWFWRENGCDGIALVRHRRGAAGLALGHFGEEAVTAAEAQDRAAEDGRGK